MVQELRPIWRSNLLTLGLLWLLRKDLDTFASWKWFARSGARLPKGETDPKPRDDEVVVFREFFYVGLRLVLEILKRFGVKFHQLTLSSFMKLSVFVWAARLRGSRWITTLFCGRTGFTTSPGTLSTRTNYESRLCESLLAFLVNTKIL